MLGMCACIQLSLVGLLVMSSRHLCDMSWLGVLLIIIFFSNFLFGLENNSSYIFFQTTIWQFENSCSSIFIYSRVLWINKLLSWCITSTQVVFSQSWNYLLCLTKHTVCTSTIFEWLDGHWPDIKALFYVLS